jgi:hypothetical protein
MENILLGREVSQHIFILNEKLKISAISQFAEQGKNIPSYVPWIAAGSDIDFEFPEILFTPPQGIKKGNLVTDSAYLEYCKSYMVSGLAKVPYNQGLLPGDRKDWLPLNASNPETAKKVAAAVEIIHSASSGFSKLYNELVEFVIPLGDIHRGYSNCDTRGVIFRGFPNEWNPYDIAIDLAHELGHHSLYVWQSIDKILTTPVNVPIYSSVRKDYRPAIQSFHGAVALSFMLYLTQQWDKNEVSNEVKIRHGKLYVGGSLESALEEAIATLKENCKFTPIGSRMIAEMQDLLTDK